MARMELQDGTAVPSCSELTPDDGQTNCPKHVEFHDKINV